KKKKKKKKKWSKICKKKKELNPEKVESAPPKKPWYRQIFFKLEGTTYLETPFDKKFAVYCSHCRHYIGEGQKGNINDYFALFGEYQIIDEEDKMLMTKLLHRQSICPNCYRPFSEETKYFRWQVLLEILSFYVFMVFLWIPLVISLLIPALLDRIWTSCKSLRISQSQGSNVLQNTEIEMNHIDFDYQEKVKQIVNKNISRESNIVDTSGEDGNNSPNVDDVFTTDELETLIKSFQTNH
ncbi:hypothetical protein RFI_30259, partial [Reticulomyxa filosa]